MVRDTAQDYSAMVGEQIPHRSLSYRLRGLGRRLFRDVLGARQAPATEFPSQAPEWTTPRFGKFAPVEHARRAAEAAPLVRKMMRDSVRWGGRIQGSYDAIEAAILFHFAATQKPQKVFELGPNRGYSTAILQAAVEDCKDLEHRSFDLHDFEEGIRFTVGRHASLRGWKLFPGPFEQVIHTQDHLAFLEQADLVFIDAAHTREFGEFYVEELRIFDRVRSGVPIHIHDMYPANHPRRAINLEAEPVFRWLHDHRDEVEVLWCSEIAGMPEVRAVLPEWMLYDHDGQFNHNPALWIRRLPKD